MIDFAARHAGTAMPGGHVWIGSYHCSYAAPPGHAAIEDDGSVWFFRVGRGERREFRQWAAAAFSGMNCKRVVVGRWPHYRVEA